MVPLGRPHPPRARRAWRDFLTRKVRWKMACERTVFFHPGETEGTSVFSDVHLFEAAVRARLPGALQNLPLRFDLARHVSRPGTRAPASGQNFLFDPVSSQIRSLDEREIFRRLPLSYRVCRIYAEDNHHNHQLARAMDELGGRDSADDLTNM